MSSREAALCIRAAIFLLLLSGVGASGTPLWAAQAKPPASSGELPPPPPLGLVDFPVPADNPIPRDKV